MRPSEIKGKRASVWRSPWDECVGGVAVLSKRDYNDYISEMIETNKC